MTAVIDDGSEAAQGLASRYGLALIDRAGAVEEGVALFIRDQGVELGGDPAEFGHPLRVDFTEGKNAHRRRFGGGRGQLIAKACGLSKGATPDIVDATAGLGRDAFVLAALGCRVLMIERVAAIAALLENGLERARTHEDTAEVAARMMFRHGDSVTALQSLVSDAAFAPEVVHLDPMFPHRDKSALVKKDMRLFRALAGDDPDASTLLTAALDTALYRVVVKRPRKAPTLDGPKPSHQVIGKTSRYDVYVHKKLP
ncbi:class I SAM-dependent methyltransferase [Larsenimonas suaedae]|uniref:Ribosomal RNA small subunit methyltransferase J n=1 Tax=Larsenimonas suaedae TaxID=1851019 RepID=A0ABU1GV34_9GAMM|nr:class I SAM-dependent methyltransferase [Larsenimonas suaedae]MCM2971875.1 class I SAM-dependent methyltransferase [Larsenimonas suaedae]MDR5895427.1 class I SAM-dependent methyltransferase [Larsenimonas suaedae]